MTISLAKPASQGGDLNTMPGWSIVGDLMPPEIIALRRLRVLRRIIAAALSILLVACVAGYLYAIRKSSAAQDDADAANAQTRVLQAQELKYTGTKRIQAAVDAIKAEVSSALATDVDLSLFVSRVRAALPTSMAIGNFTMTINANGASAPVGGLDESGAVQIGTVSISGSAQQLNDLPVFVDHLAVLKGVANVVPTSNQQSTRTVTFSVTFAVTNALYTHNYDPKAGAK